ncbi:hypothetical protein J1605_000700 [Eschrichtius robustus]|uniref:Uncharacterized protein n=1 Tax=Eschrichtius robustus TaxID=9764 RepID=A0AB34GNA1_ESCRO|nr:hypothetical protein J1605_000700 [Eschrichtius robustus]
MPALSCVLSSQSVPAAPRDARRTVTECALLGPTFPVGGAQSSGAGAVGREMLLDVTLSQLFVSLPCLPLETWGKHLCFTAWKAHLMGPAGCTVNLRRTHVLRKVPTLPPGTPRVSVSLHAVDASVQKQEVQSPPSGARGPQKEMVLLEEQHRRPVRRHWLSAAPSLRSCLEVGRPPACKAYTATAARSKVKVEKLRSWPGPLGSHLPDARSAAHLTPPSAPTPGGVEVNAGGSTPTKQLGTAGEETAVALGSGRAVCSINLGCLHRLTTQVREADASADSLSGLVLGARPRPQSTACGAFPAAPRQPRGQEDSAGGPALTALRGHGRSGRPPTHPRVRTALDGSFRPRPEVAPRAPEAPR